MGKMDKFIKEKIIGTQYEWQSHIDNVFQLINRELTHFKPKNFLDVGCGSGDRTRQVANHFQIQSENVYGVDYNHTLVSQCQEIFNAQQLDLEIEDLPFDDGCFDLVICNQVLEHLKNEQGAIENIVRVTKPQGYILIGIPNLAHLINRLFLLFGIQPLCNRLRTSHVRGFAHSAFVQILESIPDIKLISSAGALMYPLPYFLAKAMSFYFKGMSGYVCYLLQKF
jgi:ubiquinone/menaquinone biosynthesis C-methylase UbiE